MSRLGIKCKPKDLTNYTTWFFWIWTGHRKLLLPLILLTSTCFYKKYINHTCFDKISLWCYRLDGNFYFAMARTSSDRLLVATPAPNICLPFLHINSFSWAQPAGRKNSFPTLPCCIPFSHCLSLCMSPTLVSSSKISLDSILWPHHHRLFHPSGHLHLLKNFTAFNCYHSPHCCSSSSILTKTVM